MSDRRVAGRYEILREIGRGGMATVYLAHQADLRRLVALKELSALAASDVTAARRFVRESRLAGSLNHPNIVTVHDFFEADGTPYIAMEYLELGSLRPRIHELTFAQVAGVLEGLLAGLGHAHERGIVHRDIKPENLMISPERSVKIADFGIAKATDPTHAGTFLTATGTTIGTPTYMAPEQALAEGIGPWTDLYAVGVVAFEMLTDRPPFDPTGTPMQILLRHVNEDPLELSAVDPSVDPRLSEWVGRLLATEAEDRTQSAGAAWVALEEIVIDRLGSRWRRSAPLGAAEGPEPAAAVAPTPATIPVAPDAPVDQGGIPTAMPRSVRPAPEARTPGRPGASRRARTARTPLRASTAPLGGGRTARRLARSLLLLMAIVVAVTAVLAMASGHDSAHSGAPPAGSPSPSHGSEAAPRTAPRQAPRGVGDSQSDDPSDDEPDGAEP